MPEFSLQLRLTQKLALSPQLQQAIRLLQLTRLELRDYIQETVDANPLLEREETGDAQAGDTSIAEPASETAHEEHQTVDSYEWDDEPSMGDAWLEQAGYSGEFQDPQIADESTGSLREHLLWQINLGNFSETDSQIAVAIVYAIDVDGFLEDSVEEIRASLMPELSVDTDEILSVLHRIQRMEPVGVASRDPSECIRVQLSVLPSSTPGLELARRLARSYIDLVADNDLERLQKETQADGDTLDTALDLIRSLEPRPGARFDNRRDEYLVPDVYVRRIENEWVTSLSPDNDPKLKLNKFYIDLLRQRGGEDSKYLKGRLQEARWLISSLELRNQTLMKVSQSIVDQQAAFLEHGDIAMKPLILKDVAELTGVHESTVSRATTGKYMLTPRGIYELKHFFSSHVNTSDGGTVSATAVKARLQMFIENEPTASPLSDQDLADLLGEINIKAARRTVAKYRESLGIGSSSERRRAYRRMGMGQHAR